MNSKKKSQVTLFMIIGMVILIGGAVFFYSTQKAPGKLEPEIKAVQESVPFEFDPVKEYANACAYSVGVEGLKTIGKQGGYISLEDRALNKEPFTITQNPTESDAVSFTKDSELKTPYWWYLKSANSCRGDCKFASKRPELRQAENSVEKQLERYINSKFKECLNNFEPFTEQGFKISEEGKIKTDVNIGIGDVSVLVNYPITAEKQNAEAKLTQFSARVPVNLNKIYDLASKITSMEIKHRYIEKHALNLIASFSGINSQKLPPMSDMQFNFGSSTSWQKSDIKNKITGLLSAQSQLFQVDGTYNYQRNLFNSELKQRLYDAAIIPIANSSFSDLSAEFTYLDFWPAYFDLNCQGEKCAPSSANSLISFFGIQEYKFAYDLSFPVMVEIKEPFALNGQGYSFNFFLEGNIRNNKPMPSDFNPLETADVSERSLLCDARTSGNVTIAVVNAANKKPVDGVQVLYTVIDENCFIGATNGEGTLKEAFPVAAGGAVNIVRDGFIGKAVEFDAKLSSESALKIGIQPIYTKKLVVKKKNVVKTSRGWQFIDRPVDLSDKESALIKLTRINDEGELDFSSVASYDSSRKEPSEIEIAPGSYAADISLFLDERIIVPEKQKCVRKNIFGDKECFTIPKIDFGGKSTPGQERFPEGGLKLNFTVSPGDLESHNEIALYVVSTGIADIPEQERVVEDIDQINKIEDYSGTYQLALQPSFT